MTGRMGAAACLLAASVSIVVALRPVAVSSNSLTSSRLGTPMWSPRRVPALLADAAGVVKLDGSLDRALKGVSACLVAGDGSNILLAREADKPLAPASNQKLLVAAAALARLGPNYRFETKLVARERPRGGVLGEVWLVGSGDPVLSTPEYQQFLEAQPLTTGRPTTSLDDLAKAMQRAGISEIRGRIHGDDSRYTRRRAIATWKTAYLTDHEVGPIGALTVNEGWQTWAPRSAAADPSVLAASELTRLVASRGIATADGATDAAVAPGEAETIAVVRSPSLGDIVAAMLRESSNLTAEMLVRELGRRDGDGGTEAGLTAVAQELRSLRLPTEGLALTDGSGLDVSNRSTCKLLFETLALGDKGGGGAGTFAPMFRGLAVAGRSGTLVRRMAGTELEGRLRAKTGAIDGVAALTGLVDGKRDISFAFIANGAFSDPAGRSLQERVAGLLARFPEAPPVDLLRPLPPVAVAG